MPPTQKIGSKFILKQLFQTSHPKFCLKTGIVNRTVRAQQYFFLIFLLMFRRAIDCLLWALAGKKSCSISVLFDLSERLTFRDVQSPQEFHHGETAEVVCDVISSPVPVVVWYYQDKEITEEHRSKFSWPYFTIELFCLPWLLLLFLYLLCAV